MKPVVSVMCCTFNQEKYIKECLEGFVKQETAFPFEVIVHDDASRDSTPELVREYENKYPDIFKCIYQKTNQFSTSPKKINDYVYPLLTGKYIAFCEGDDYWCDPKKLQKQYDAMEQHRNCTLCVHKVRKIYENGSNTGSCIEPVDFTAGEIEGTGYIQRLYSRSENLFQTSSYFIKKEILFSIPKSLNETFFVGDMPLVLWAAENGNIIYLDDLSSCYRVMSEGSTNRMLQDRDYAIMRIKSSIAGNLAFNKETNGRYWEYIKKDVYRKQAQIYYCDRSALTKDEMKEVLTELSFNERIIARIKFTYFGNFLRNLKQKLRLLSS